MTPEDLYNLIRGQPRNAFIKSLELLAENEMVKVCPEVTPSVLKSMLGTKETDDPFTLKLLNVVKSHSIKPSEDETEAWGIIDQCINLMGKIEYSGYLFQRDDIKKIILFHDNLTEACLACGGGDSRIVIAKLKDGKYLQIENHCGCLTYDESYFGTLHETLTEAMKDVDKAIERTLKDRDRYGLRNF